MQIVKEKGREVYYIVREPSWLDLLFPIEGFLSPTIAFTTQLPLAWDYSGCLAEADIDSTLLAGKVSGLNFYGDFQDFDEFRSKLGEISPYENRGGYIYNCITGVHSYHAGGPPPVRTPDGKKHIPGGSPGTIFGNPAGGDRNIRFYRDEMGKRFAVENYCEKEAD
jgi:hypothetical protein